MSLLSQDLSFFASLLQTSLKGTLLILVVALVQWLGRDRIPPAWRYAMWLLVVLRLLLPAGPESRFSVFNLLNPAATQQQSVPAAVGIPPGVSLPRIAIVAEAVPPASSGGSFYSAGTIAVGVWALGALLLLLRASTRTRALASMIEGDRQETAEEGSDLEAARKLLDRSRRRMNIRREVGLVETTSVDAPALHGIIRPRILLPIGLIEQFDGDELEYIFLHELAHLRRHDVALNVVSSFVQAVHWFNPLVWLAFSRMREERELACDELALAVLRQDERPRYGRTILKLIEAIPTASPVPALVGITNHKEQMRRRITMIATFQKHSRKSVLFAAMILMIGAVSLTEAQTKVRVMKMDSPDAHATFERLDQKITLEMAQVSVEEVFNAISNQTGVRVSLAPELAASIGTLDRVTIKAGNMPAHLVLIQAAASVGLAVDPNADGAVVSKSDGASPRVMVLQRNGEGIDKETDVLRILKESGVEGAVDGEEGKKQVMVKVMRHPAPDAAAGVEPVIVESIEKIRVDGKEGAKTRVHVVAPGAEGGVGKRHLEIQMKGEDGSSTSGTLDIEVHSDEATL